MVRSYCSRQGDRSTQPRITPVAHAVVCSLWQVVHGFGMPYFSVIAGVMNRKVCAWTMVLGGPSVSIAGMWQATHWPPGLPSL
jgi:hypothetical protein